MASTLHFGSIIVVVHFEHMTLYTLIKLLIDTITIHNGMYEVLIALEIGVYNFRRKTMCTSSCPLSYVYDSHEKIVKL